MASGIPPKKKGEKAPGTDAEPTYRMSMLPFATYANPDGTESLGLAVPGMIKEPFDALQRLAANSVDENGNIAIPNPENPQNRQDVLTGLLSMYGGNALSPGRLMEGAAARAAPEALPAAERLYGKPTQAASYYNGELFTGRNHGEAYNQAVAKYGEDAVDDMILRDGMQDGFVDNAGNFMDRMTANELSGGKGLNAYELLSDTGKPSLFGSAIAGARDNLQAKYWDWRYPDEAVARSYNQIAKDKPNEKMGSFDLRRSATSNGGGIKYDIFNGSEPIASLTIDAPKRLSPTPFDMATASSFEKLESAQPLAGTITRIEVNEGHQGKGIASHLLDVAEKDLKGAGAILHPGDTNMTQDFMNLYAKRDPEMMKDAFARMGVGSFDDPALMFGRSMRVRASRKAGSAPLPAETLFSDNLPSLPGALAAGQDTSNPNTDGDGTMMPPILQSGYGRMNPASAPQVGLLSGAPGVAVSNPTPNAPQMALPAGLLSGMDMSGAAPQTPPAATPAPAGVTPVMQGLMQGDKDAIAAMPKMDDIQFAAPQRSPVDLSRLAAIAQARQALGVRA